MPLSPTGPDLSFFSDPPADVAGTAEAWATAMGSYMDDLFFVSTTVATAQSALQTSLELSLDGATDAATAFDAAMLTFAGAVGLGMSGGGFAGLPPTGPFSGMVFLGGEYDDAAVASAAIALEIYDWFITGTATLAVAPFTVYSWS